jgi:hypothetical protein
MGAADTLRSWLAKGEPWVRRCFALGAILVGLHGVWVTTDRIRAKSRHSGEDIVAHNQGRWAEAQAFLTDKVPAGPLGYLLVSDPAQVSEDSRTAQYFSSQFVLLPWRLEQDLNDPSLHWAVADFAGVSPDGWNPPAGWTVIRHYPGGVAVLQRASAGKERVP